MRRALRWLAVLVAAAIVFGAGALTAALTGASDDPVAARTAPPASPRSTAPPGPAGDPDPANAARRLLSAWRAGDEQALADLGTPAALARLSRVPTGGWKLGRCQTSGSGSSCPLSRAVRLGPMHWTLARVSTAGYVLTGLEVPPLPLDIRKVGDRVWAAYVASGAPGASSISAALDALSPLGLTLGNHLVLRDSLSCQAPAAAALGVPDSYEAVAVLFAAKGDAQAFGGASRVPVEDVVRVAVTCG